MLHFLLLFNVHRYNSLWFGLRLNVGLNLGFFLDHGFLLNDRLWLS